MALENIENVDIGELVNQLRNAFHERFASTDSMHAVEYPKRLRKLLHTFNYDPVQLEDVFTNKTSVTFRQYARRVCNKLGGPVLLDHERTPFEDYEVIIDDKPIMWSVAALKSYARTYELNENPVDDKLFDDHSTEELTEALATQEIHEGTYILIGRDLRFYMDGNTIKLIGFQS